MSLEEHFDIGFTAAMALREKQIQQSYRPIIGVHKWFARRPGTLFRSLLLAEFNGTQALMPSFYQEHQFSGLIADPFMGGGTPLIEANRLGFDILGVDVNPLAWWIVRQEVGDVDIPSFAAKASELATELEALIGDLYLTECDTCGESAPVKYFLWVKTPVCPHCSKATDAFPGYLVAESSRHPKNVFLCPHCGRLAEVAHRPSAHHAIDCPLCGKPINRDGPARRGSVACQHCGKSFGYHQQEHGPPNHRLFAIEYHCLKCKKDHSGRFFKIATEEDLQRFVMAQERLRSGGALPIPEDAIPAGDETDRLRRWGYERYRDLFGDRQLLGLGLLLARIQAVPDAPTRHALLTVFSDFLRYQNMLCRYDTYALKCQDVFSVHGFPVGLVQCENNLLGIPGVGSGGFRHFVEKYRRAREFCAVPFEVSPPWSPRKRIAIKGESIGATMTDALPQRHEGERQAWLSAQDAQGIGLPPASLDGVFTDPPYFANVQYAELMDFCYVWLRQALASEFDEFKSPSTRAAEEITGNATSGRLLEHYAAGLSGVFSTFAAALKPGAPFVFTFHHNDLQAYAAVAVAILDAGLVCSTVLPAPGEMGASLHINKTGSSVLDSVFVCRHQAVQFGRRVTSDILGALTADCVALTEAGIRLTAGDIRCLGRGQLTAAYTRQQRAAWDSGLHIAERLHKVINDLSARETQLLAGNVFDRARELALKIPAPPSPREDSEDEGVRFHATTV
jgi:adenine-specific DNA methylase